MGSNKSKVMQMSDEDKIKVVIEIFTSKDRLPDACRKWGISLGSYYQLKNRLIEDGNQLRRVRKRAVNYLFQ